MSEQDILQEILEMEMHRSWLEDSGELYEGELEETVREITELRRKLRELRTLPLPL